MPEYGVIICPNGWSFMGGGSGRSEGGVGGGGGGGVRPPRTGPPPPFDIKYILSMQVCLHVFYRQNIEQNLMIPTKNTNIFGSLR